MAVLVLSGSAHTDPFPKDYFQSPLEIPLLLSGGFAEMRSNHFHAGLDIKTEGRTGHRVRASADGWVSRINVSPTGYGNALYVNHPNGYQTVYAHLDRFSDDIQAYAKELQYGNESFDIQTFPEKDRFPVRQGDLIAWSGNTGGSGGPHLHFEIRDAATAEPLNPMLFGLPVIDSTAPRIFRVKIYAASTGSSVRLEDTRSGGWRRLGPGESAMIDVVASPSGLRFDRIGRIEASGPVGFGIQTHDYHDGSNNHLGPYRIRLDANLTTVFDMELQRFSFSDTRFLNAHVDYAEYQSSRRWVQRSHVLPGNRLPLYEAHNNGWVNVPSDGFTEMTYVVEDVAGNTSRLVFTIHGLDEEPAPAPRVDQDRWVDWRFPFTLATPDLAVRVPEGAVYDSFELDYAALPPGSQSLSARHRIHHSGEPIHSSVNVRIAADHIPPRLRSKVLLGRFDGEGNVSSAGGGWSAGNVAANVRSFGVYGIVADTTAPSIRPLNITRGASMRGRSNVALRVRDSLSGLALFEGRIDGEWRLFEYDAKNALFTHHFDERTAPGSHVLTIRAVDNKGNENRMEIPFSR
ncbi:MAG: M23 family metallopeptidase [Rhodothermales bacterium]